ncbi:MAG: SPOR domain-containing protein [Campylobacterales bacterium]
MAVEEKNELNDILLGEPEKEGDKKRIVLIIAAVLLLFFVVVGVMRFVNMDEEQTKPEINATKPTSLLENEEAFQPIPLDANTQERAEASDQNLDSALAKLKSDSVAIEPTQPAAQPATTQQTPPPPPVAPLPVKTTPAPKEKEEPRPSKPAVVKKELPKPQPQKKAETKPAPQAKPKSEPISIEAPKTTTVAPESQTPNKEGAYYIQAARLYQKSPSKQLLDALKAQGLPYRVKDDGSTIRVIVGPFNSEQEARSQIEKVRSIAPGAFLRKE